MDWSDDLRFWLRVHILKCVLFSMYSWNSDHHHNDRNDFDNKHNEGCYYDSLINRQSRVEMARC